MSYDKAFYAIVLIVLVTAALRFAPFIILQNRQTPKIIKYLGLVLPYATMGMLVVYCLKDVSFSSAVEFVPALVASTVVVLTYVWRKNTLLSIIGGTAVYMILVQFVFT